MALPRPSCLRGAAGRSTLRRAGAQSRSNAFRHGGRRTYASGHEAKKSSDLPWAIGSAVVTIPAATWLLGQTPTKSDHHETEPKVVEGSDGDEGSEEKPKEEDGGNDSKDESKGGDDKEESKSKDKSDESKDEGKSDDSGSEDEGKDTPPPSDDDSSNDEEYEKPSPGSPGQINKIGQSKGQKPRNATEKKGEKDSAKDYSGAQHPYLDDENKSKKVEGVTETAKIHGTVDPKRNSSKE